MGRSSARRDWERNDRPMTMKISPSVFLMLAILLSSCASPKSIGKNGDEAPPKNFEYLLNNFDQFYASDYALFWDVIRAAADKARKCEIVEDSVRFIGLSKNESNNAEFNEFFSDAVEHMALENPKCLLAAISKSDGTVRSAMLNRLRHPIFVEVSDMDRSLDRYSRGRFRFFVKDYFGDRPKK